MTTVSGSFYRLFYPGSNSSYRADHFVQKSQNSKISKKKCVVLEHHSRKRLKNIKNAKKKTQFWLENHQQKIDFDAKKIFISTIEKSTESVGFHLKTP